MQDIIECHYRETILSRRADVCAYFSTWRPDAFRTGFLCYANMSLQLEKKIEVTYAARFNFVSIIHLSKIINETDDSKIIKSDRIYYNKRYVYLKNREI